MALGPMGQGSTINVFSKYIPLQALHATYANAICDAIVQSPHVLRPGLGGYVLRYVPDKTQLRSKRSAWYLAIKMQANLSAFSFTSRGLDELQGCGASRRDVALRTTQSDLTHVAAVLVWGRFLV